MKIRTIFDQLGRMGQKEIARSYSACLRMLMDAGGAGMITALTVIFKTLILHSSLTWIAAGVLGALNFIVSFLSMQVFGFKLATKQSSLFGAALGRRWNDLKSGISHHFFHEEFHWSFRTQISSAMGNLTFVIPAAFIFHWIFKETTGNAFLDPLAAQASLQSLHPFKTGTLIYAAFTGCILWVCTFYGGIVANRFDPFSKTAATALFNIFLGFLLAFTPLLGHYLGLPIDVRHFTLSGGMVAIATASLGFKKALEAGLMPAVLGVFAIGALNFGVSFALAFVTAMLKSSRVPALR